MKCTDIFGFSQLTDAVISPAGDAVAFVQRTADRESDSYACELRVAHVQGALQPGASRSLGTGMACPAWAPDGRRLAAVEYRAGEPTASVVSVSTTDGAKRKLVSGVVKPAGIAWSPDGAEVGFLAVVPPRALSGSAPAPHAAAAPTVISDLSSKIDGLGVAISWRRHLFAVDCGTGVVRQLTDGDLWIEDFCYSPSGLVALCGSGPWSGSMPRQPGAIRPSTLWVMNTRDGVMRELATGEASARSVLFAGDEQVIFIGGPKQRADLHGLFAVPVGGRPARRLAAALDRGAVVGSASYLHGARSAADGELVFSARDGGCVRLYQTSMRRSASIRELAGAPAESVTAVSSSHRGDRLAYVSATEDGYQRLIVLGLPSGIRTVLAEAAPPAEVRLPVREEFTARDGLKLEGWLIRGNRPGRTPLLVDVHGGSFSGAWSPVVQPSRLYQQELAGRGWTVLLLNARGSDGYGSEFARAAVGAWGQADAPDFHDAIDTLASRGLIDPARLAVTGYSYGGFMTNWLTATSDRFSAAVAGGSICDFVSLFGTSDMGWVMSEYDIGVHPHIDPAAALRRSPIGLGRAVRTPTLLLHGEADLRCPISQAEEWLAMLLGSGCQAEMVRYPGASHGFLTQGPPSLAADYGTRLVKWVTRHVSRDAPPPAKPAA